MSDNDWKAGSPGWQAVGMDIYARLHDASLHHGYMANSGLDYEDKPLVFSSDSTEQEYPESSIVCWKWKDE